MGLNYQRLKASEFCAGGLLASYRIIKRKCATHKEICRDRGRGGGQ